MPEFTDNAGAADETPAEPTAVKYLIFARAGTDEDGNLGPEDILNPPELADSLEPGERGILVDADVVNDLSS